MQKKIRFEVLLVIIPFFVGLAFFVHAAQVVSSPQVLTTSEAAPSGKGQAQAKTEEDMLRAQLEVIRDYDQRLLATVYASLGGVFLLVVLVGGLNWFTNYRLYERERDSLRQALQFASQEEAAKLTQGFEEFRKGTEDRLATFSAGIKVAAAEAAKSSSSSIQRSFFMAEFENTKFRAEYFASKDEGYRAFQAWVEHMEALDALGWLGDERWAGNTIEKILGTLPKTSAVSYTLLTTLFKLLEKTPPILSSDVERLKKAVEAKKRV